MTGLVCVSPVCDRQPSARRGMCFGHYSRWQRTGDARLNEPIRGTDHTFWRYVVKSDGCWTWLGKFDEWGYADATYKRRHVRGHKVAYELTHGPVPQGMQLDHFACDNRGCVNPDHVRPVTPRENTLRSGSVSSVNLAKDECINGHLFAGHNLIVRPEGGRKCRTCALAASARYRTKKRQEIAA